MYFRRLAALLLTLGSLTAQASLSEILEHGISAPIKVPGLGGYCEQILRNQVPGRRLSLFAPPKMLADLNRAILKTSDPVEARRLSFVLADALLEQGSLWGEKIARIYRGRWNQIDRNDLSRVFTYGPHMEAHFSPTGALEGLVFHDPAALRHFVRLGGAEVFRTWGLRRLEILTKSSGDRDELNQVLLDVLALNEASEISELRIGDRYCRTGDSLEPLLRGLAESYYFRKRLKHLTIEGNRVSPEILNWVGKLNELRSLALVAVAGDISAEQLADLKRLTKLETLAIRDSLLRSDPSDPYSAFPTRLFKGLAALKTLKTLHLGLGSRMSADMSSFSQLTREAVEILALLPHLENLILRSWYIPMEALSNFSLFKSIKRFDFMSTKFEDVPNLSAERKKLEELPTRPTVVNFWYR